MTNGTRRVGDLWKCPSQAITVDKPSKAGGEGAKRGLQCEESSTGGVPEVFSGVWSNVSGTFPSGNRFQNGFMSGVFFGDGVGLSLYSSRTTGVKVVSTLPREALLLKPLKKVPTQYIR